MAKRLKMPIVSIILLLLSGIYSTALRANDPIKPVAEKVSLVELSQFDHSLWSQLLKKNTVTVGLTTQVNYDGMAQETAMLQQYLDTLSSVTWLDFNRWEKSNQLAFLLNTYNAWTVKLVLSDYKNIKSIKALGHIFKSPWKKEFISLFQDKVSLDHIEHTLIRGSGRYRDPRIHFAVNCASIGCPALRNEAYDGMSLDRQLEEQTNAFLRDTSRNFVKNNQANLSSIFKWYREDFEKGWRDAYSLTDFLLIYSDALSLNSENIRLFETQDISITFLDYDWTLNRVK